MRASIVLVLASFLSVLFPSAGANAKLNVVATLPSFADIAAQVGGDEVSVTSLTRGTQDPHFVDARPDLVLKLNRADLIIHAGLGLEDGWLPPLLVGARNGAIQAGGAGNLPAATLVSLLDRDRSTDRAGGDVHPGGNPHYMLDPRNGIALARGIAGKLASLEPDKAEGFRKRAEAFASRLKDRIAAWEKDAKPSLGGKQLVTYHRSWIYLTEWLGLKTMGHVEPKPGIPPSPGHVVRLVQQMKEGGVKALVMEPFYPKGVNEDIARQTGARLLVLPSEVGGVPEAKTYEAMFDHVVKELKAAFPAPVANQTKAGK